MVRFIPYKGQKLSEEHKEKIRQALIIKVDKEQIYNLYYNQKKSSQQISDILGVSKRTILRRMKEYNFERRHDFNGTNNPNWKGDKTEYSGIHRWMRENNPIPKTCQHCGNKCKVELSKQ